MSALGAIIIRDIRLAWRAGGGALQGIIFFILIGVFFSFAIGPNIALIASIAPPVIWAAALLATQLSLDQIWRADKEDGSLEILIEASDGLSLTALTKAIAHWLASLAPIIVIAPALAIMLNLPSTKYSPLILSLLIGTPALSLIGTFGAALAISLPRAGLLTAILTGPLYIPVLIFGAGAIGNANGSANLMLLAAYSLFAAIISPLAAAAALRFNLD